MNPSSQTAGLASDDERVSATDSFARDLWRLLALGCLAVIAMAMMELFGVFIDVFPDSLQIRLGSSTVPIHHLVSLLVLGTIAGGAFLYLRTMSRSSDPNGQDSFLWHSTVGMFVIASLILVRIVVDSSGLIPGEAKLSAMLPRVEWIGSAAGLMTLFALAMTIWRGLTGTHLSRWLWSGAAYAAVALTVWWLAQSFQTADFQNLLLLSLTGWIVSVWLRRGIRQLLSGVLGDEDAIPEGMTRFQLTVVVIMATVSTAHGVVGFFHPMPAWKMFRRIERWTYELEDQAGNPIIVRDFVPPRAYTVAGHNSVFSISRWIAETQPERTPLLATIRQGRVRGGELVWTEERFQIVVQSSASESSSVQILPLE